MKIMLKVKRMVLLGFAILPLLAVPAFADYIFDADMTADQVAPPSGSTAYGHATLIMNDAQTQVAYTVNFAGLDAVQTGAGFFIGAPGTVGTQAMNLPGSVPMAGIWQIDAQTAAALMAEELYVNVFSSTQLFPDGEIRGNFTLTIVGDEPASWDGVKALYR